MSESTVATTQTIFPGLRYTDAHAAIAWLERAFDAKRHAVYDAPDGTVAHAELMIGGNVIMLGSVRDDGYPVRSPKDAGVVTSSIYVVLPDAAAVEAMHERAKDAGATIVAAPYDTEYGSREFATTDLDGQRWSFGTYQPHGTGS